MHYLATTPTQAYLYGSHLQPAVDKGRSMLKPVLLETDIECTICQFVFIINCEKKDDVDAFSHVKERLVTKT